MTYRLIENVNYTTISYHFKLDVVLPIGSRIILKDKEYEIVNYITGCIYNDYTDYIIIVRKVTSRDLEYLDRISY